MRIHFFPYCIEKIDDKTYVFLNRNYQPIGYTGESKDWVDYKKYGVKLLRNISKTSIQRISCHSDNDGTRFWLYDDSCVPFRVDKKATASYLRKLEILAKLAVND